MKFCLYINPNIPAVLKRSIIERYPSVPLVSATRLTEIVEASGGLEEVSLEHGYAAVCISETGEPEGESRALTDYAAVLIDESGGVGLFSIPMIPLKDALPPVGGVA